MSTIEELLNNQGQLASVIEKFLINFKKDGPDRKTAQNIKRRSENLEQYWKEFQANHIALCEFENREFIYFAENHYDRVSSIYHEARNLLYQCLPEEAKPIIRPATPQFKLNVDWTQPLQEHTEGGPSSSFGRNLSTPQPPPVPQSNVQKVERGNQSKLEEMYRKQQSNFKAFQRAINNITLELLTERWEFEDALKTVQARWTVIDTLHWEIDSEQINEKPEYEETYNKCEQKYNDIKKRINIKMWDSSHREKSTPKIEIPIFHGNYHQWTSFKDLFTETIHKNNTISNAQKMQFLKSKVKGEAEKLIQNLKISTDNYQVCWEILNHRYNNKKLIFSSHINILLGIPTMQQQTAVAIKRLHDNTKESLHAIQNLGVNTSSWDPLIVHLLAQKLDADSHNDYIEHVADPRELPTLTEFLSFLEAKFTALESSRRKQELKKRCKQCNGEHNTILHEAFVGRKKGAANEPSTSKHVGHVFQEDEDLDTLLSTAQIKLQSNDGSYIKFQALIDQGSQLNLISENAAQQLGLPRQSYSGTVFGIGNKESECKGYIIIKAASIHTDYTFMTKVYIMNRLTVNLPNQSFSKPSWPHLEGIPLADPEFNISKPIDILFGAGIYARIILGSLIRTDDVTPIAQESKLGWLLCGDMQSYHCHMVQNNIEDISRFWEIEDIAETSDVLSSEDQYCINQYKSETTRREDGRYVVRLPLKPDIEEKLGESRTKAVAQFYQLERKLMKNEKLSEDYKSFINEYYELGHMRECERDTKPNNFLPHHCVQRAESSTTALRVVYNASAPTSSGYSLNDQMYRGPNLQSDLFKLILRWRQYKIVFLADIEKMFRQILCNEEDQLYQKIIWREHPKKALREYALTTVTYGTKAAPFLAMMTLKQLAIDEGHRYPEAAKILDQDFYMDDLLSGTHDVVSAKKIQSDLINLLKAGGFNLRKWSSNNPGLLESVDTANRQQSFDFKHQESQKTLGLRWNPQNDAFTFQLKIQSSPTNKTTKRSLLSDISKIFDPLGWLCPITTKLKLLFQSVWKEENLKWDDQVSDAIENEWKSIKQDLYQINHIKIPRWLQNEEKGTIELHCFCDSSERAYACVIYSVIRNSCTREKSTPPLINIVAAKSKLVPAKKAVTLPRLELSSALLLSKLLKNVMESLSSNNIKLFCWVDSTAVLGWLQGDVNRWKPFVANRVQRIIEIAPSDCWQYVRSAENPADCASRGISATQLKEHPLWWTGPSWLSTFEEKPQEVIYTTEVDIKSSKQTNVTTLQGNNVVSDLIIKHSNINRMTRVLAWVLRAVSINKPTVSYLTVAELRKARNIIIKHVQRASFGEDINNLARQGQVKSSSNILSLNPFLDDNGLLRVRGRIGRANIDPNMKHPLIIPHQGHLTNLLIDNAHRLTLHGGARLTLRQLRYQFWIIGGNRAVKKYINNCVTCIRHRAMTQEQIMGDLPAARCNPTRPFYHTGCDYTGYIDVKSNKGRGVKTTKGYIAVFVCMVTKAVHLELVSDLSSSAFLAALRRMAARRGAPRHIYSDQGTNFIGSNKRLNEEMIDLRGTLDAEFFTTISEMEIEWHFNAPSWPSAGGLWEASVKSLKHHLRRVMGEQKLTYEELLTLITQSEACLNSRPLCAITEDPDDLDFLTPSHFLSSGPNLTIYETERDERTRWQLVQKIFSDIWKRWKSDYLCQLSKRSKWLKPKENLKVGDIVIIHDANLPAGKWALGKVVTVHPGQDGYVRVVSIKTKNGQLKRPITKLSKLPVNEESNEVPKSEPEPKNPESEVKKRRIKRSGNLMTLALMLLFTLISPAQCEHSLTNINKQQGVYFDQISNMHFIRDEWKLVVYYNMGPYWQGRKLFKEYLNSLENMCIKADKQSKCDVILIQLRHGFAELEYYNNIMLAQQFTRSARRRRGLINGVGYIANSLFGTLDERFAQKYEKDINLIRDNEKHLALLWKNQTSVVEAEYNLLKRVEEAMDKQHKILNRNFINLEKATNVLAKEVVAVENTSEFMLSSIITNSMLVNLKSIQETLLETITNVHNGQFNFHLLTPAQLKDELSIISGQLSKDLTIPIENIQTDLPHIYQLLKVKTKMTTKYLIFEIRIPLVSRDNFEIYRLIPVPQQLKEDMISITPISEYVAINIQKDSFIPLSEKEAGECKQHDVSNHLCPLQRPIYHMYGDDNLCIKDKNETNCKSIKQPCTDKWEMLNKENNYLFFCCGHRTIRIICEAQVTAEQISGAGIISLGDGCIIKSESLSIFAHKHHTNNINIQPNMMKIELPPINNIINLSLPPLHEDIASIPTNTDLKKQFLDIDRLIEHMKASETRGILADRISSHDVHQYVLVYLLLGTAIVVFSVYLWTRLRLRRSAQVPPAPPSDASANMRVQYDTRDDIQREATPQPTATIDVQPKNNSRIYFSRERGLDKATSPIVGGRFATSE